jgi:hypothetical protein
MKRTKRRKNYTDPTKVFDGIEALLRWVWGLVRRR